MFESLTEKLGAVFGRLNQHGTITEKDLDEAMREVRLALLEADVNFRVVKQFIADVKEKALGAEVHKALNPVQQIIQIVNDELIEVLGKDPFMKKVMDSQKAWVKRVVYYTMLNSADYRVAYEHHFGKLPL